MLETADVLEIAMKSVPKDELSETSSNKYLKDLYQGVVMTQKELHSIFKRHGVEAYDPKGQDFDPNLHEALFKVENVEMKDNTVSTTIKTGYMLNGRVLRAAQVGVVKQKD